MKRIFKFIAPNGEYVEWGEFNEKKQVATFEVKKFSDDGILLETQNVDFIVPEKLDLETAPTNISAYRSHGFRKTNERDQTVLVDAKDEGDPREILND